VETYVRALIPSMIELRPDVRMTIFVSEPGRELLSAEPWAADVELVTRPWLGRRYVSALAETLALGRLADAHGVDLLHSLGMVGPLRLRAAHVLMVHDLIWMRVPDPAQRVTQTVWRVVVPPVARRADRVLTLSDASRDDIARLLRVPRERIDVVAPGGGTGRGPVTPAAELRERFQLEDGPLVLTVSAKKRHKNLLRLVRAMATVRERFPGAVVVMPGNPTPHEDELRAEAARLGIADALRLPAYVSPPDLEGLYQAAECFVFPSLMEGFGLPVLEAFERGVPVACARASSLPEVAGDAVRYFDPEDESEMAAALVELLADPPRRAELVRLGHERRARFSWRSTAEQTLEVYERALAARRSSS
jgi:glycosyltransferase involved in cell wall biosynthesis